MIRYHIEQKSKDMSSSKITHLIAYYYGPLLLQISSHTLNDGYLCIELLHKFNSAYQFLLFLSIYCRVFSILWRKVTDPLRSINESSKPLPAKRLFCDFLCRRLFNYGGPPMRGGRVMLLRILIILLLPSLPRMLF